MMAMDPKLPEARLRPRDGADRLAILRGQARDSARTAGRGALIVTKTFAMVALCGAGLFAIGTGTRSRSTYDLDRRLDNIRRMNESTLQMLKQPKLDFDAYYRNLDYRSLDFRPVHPQMPGADGVVRDPTAPPSAAEPLTSSP